MARHAFQFSVPVSFPFAPLHRLALCAWLLLAAVIGGCGGGGGGDNGSGSGSDRAAPVAVAVPASAAAAAVAPAAGRGTLLQTTWSAYPRLVRLATQGDASRNGRIVASLTESVGGRLQAGFHASDDDGAHFHRIGTLTDPAFAAGLCCGTLFELPQAVGALGAGTLLYAGSVGADLAGGLMHNAIFRSDDGGAQFRRLDGAACGRSAVARGAAATAGGSGIWEPEFFMAADGSLACIFSDETLPNQSQVLRLTRTVDGVNWSAPRTIVAGAAASDRPGMAGVRRLPGGRYVMVFEVCSSAALDCATQLKTSPDGLEWGSPADFGVRPRTASGQFFRHAPTLAWAPAASGASSGGALLLIGQILAGASGAADAGLNGQVLLVNDARGIGGGEPALLCAPWRVVAAPIGLAQPPAVSNWCQNYSSPLLPRTDGSGVLLMQTDRATAADEGCSARFGSGPLTY